MKRSRRFISFVLAVLTCCALGGCTTETPDESSNPIDTTLAPEADTSAPAEETTAEVIEEVKSDFEIYQSNSITPSACNYALKSADGSPVRTTFKGVYKIQEYGEEYVILDESIAAEQYGICFRKDDAAICEAVEGAFMQLVENGTYVSLAEKYGLDTAALCLLSK